MDGCLSAHRSRRSCRGDLLSQPQEGCSRHSAGIMASRDRNRGRPASQTAISEWRLTANPFDTPVTSGVISPDGKLLAYTDTTGLYLRQVDNGETHPIALPKGIDPRVESWFPDRVHLLASWADNPEKPPGLWQISVVGGAARKLIDEGSS